MLVVHHIVADGWSMGVLLREVAAFYGAAPNEDPLAPLPISYADYARWQREWLRGEELERQMVTWRARLAGVPPLELPTDRPRRELSGRRGELLPVVLPGHAPAELGRRRGATLHMTLLAALTVVLGRDAGQTDVAVGTPIANRRRVETEGLIGFFVNTLALRVDLGGRPRFVELLDRVKTVALEAHAHQASAVKAGTAAQCGRNPFARPATPAIPSPWSSIRAGTPCGSGSAPMVESSKRRPASGFSTLW